MTLRLEDKKQIVAQVADVAQNALSAVVAGYRGLTVQEITQLRKTARETGVHIQVVRNTLAKRAVEDTDFACMQDVLSGPVLLAFSLDEPGAAARLLRNFGKKHEKLEVKALSISGRLLDATQLEALASLPTRDEARAMLLRTMQAPATQLLRTMTETYGSFVRVLSAVAEQKSS